MPQGGTGFVLWASGSGDRSFEAGRGSLRRGSGLFFAALLLSGRVDVLGNEEVVALVHHLTGLGFKSARGQAPGFYPVNLGARMLGAALSSRLLLVASAVPRKMKPPAALRRIPICAGDASAVRCPWFFCRPSRGARSNRFVV